MNIIKKKYRELIIYIEVYFAFEFYTFNNKYQNVIIVNDHARNNNTKDKSNQIKLNNIFFESIEMMF